jgi:ubiquinone/menaquinone biosynthesis C-methylase UbiE
MRRIPEPKELMDEQTQAVAYAGADFVEANQLFAALLRQLRPQGLAGTLLDLGCGPADIPLALLQEYPETQIDALDGAPAMLAQAERNLDAHPALRGRLQLLCHTLPCNVLPQGYYQAVLSNSLLHHLSNPDDLWTTLRHCASDGAAILVMDLARPGSPLAVDTLVETYALDEPEVLREDFRNSLHAAYTPAEIADQLQANGLGYLNVATVSDRHWAVSGHYRAGR